MPGMNKNATAEAVGYAGEPLDGNRPLGRHPQQTAAVCHRAATNIGDAATNNPSVVSCRHAATNNDNYHTWHTTTNNATTIYCHAGTNITTLVVCRCIATDNVWSVVHTVTNNAPSNRLLSRLSVGPYAHARPPLRLSALCEGREVLSLAAVQGVLCVRCRVSRCRVSLGARWSCGVGGTVHDDRAAAAGPHSPPCPAAL